MVAAISFRLMVPSMDNPNTNYITTWFSHYPLNTSSALGLRDSRVLINRVRSYSFLYTDGQMVYDRYLDGISASDLDVTNGSWFENAMTSIPSQLTVEKSNLTHYTSIGMYLFFESISVVNDTQVYTCEPSNLLFKANWSWAPSYDEDNINFTNIELRMWDSFNQTHELELQLLPSVRYPWEEPGIIIHADFPQMGYSPNLVVGIIIGFAEVIGVIVVLSAIRLKQHRSS